MGDIKMNKIHRMEVTLVDVRTGVCQLGVQECEAWEACIWKSVSRSISAWSLEMVCVNCSISSSSDIFCRVFSSSGDAMLGKEGE
jgi:hypothetical protein